MAATSSSRFYRLGRPPPFALLMVVVVDVVVVKVFVTEEFCRSKAKVKCCSYV
jgi:hypothetical protein